MVEIKTIKEINKALNDFKCRSCNTQINLYRELESIDGRFCVNYHCRACNTIEYLVLLFGGL